MTFKEWLNEQNIKPEEFAEKYGMPIGTVNAYYYGYRDPKREQVNRIYHITKGKVTANDFYHGGE